MPHLQRSGRRWRHGTRCDAQSAAFADAVDIDRHRQEALQTRHPRLLGAHARWPRHPACYEPLAHRQGACGTSSTKTDCAASSSDGGRAIRRNPSTASWFPISTTRHSVLLAMTESRAGRCRPTPSILQSFTRRWLNFACIRRNWRAPWWRPSFPCWRRWIRIKTAASRCCARRSPSASAFIAPPHGSSKTSRGIFSPSIMTRSTTSAMASCGIIRRASRGFRSGISSCTRNVVSTAYRFHDQMLGTLLSKAPADTRVALMSDHGFHPDHSASPRHSRYSRGPGDRT